MGQEELKCALVKREVSPEIMVRAVGDPHLRDEFQEKYKELCRKLDLMELLENGGEDDEDERKMPLPSYDDLRQQAEVEYLKVGSYMKGRDVYDAEVVKKKTGKIEE